MNMLFKKKNKDGTFALCILVTGFEVLQMIKPQTQ